MDRPENRRRGVLRMAAAIIAVTAGMAAITPSASACVLTFAAPQLKPHFWVEKTHGQAKGLAKDFFDRVGAAMDCQIRYLERPWRRVLRDIRRGAVDFTIGVKTPETEAFARFSSRPFGENRFHLFGRPAAHHHASLEEYFKHAHRLIYAQGWDLGDLRKTIDAHRGAAIATTLQRGILMVAAGRSKGLLGPLKPTLFEIKQAGLSDVVKIRSQPLATFKQYVFFSRTGLDAAVFRRFDAAMTEAIDAGVMTAIIQTYTGH